MSETFLLYINNTVAGVATRASAREAKHEAENLSWDAQKVFPKADIRIVGPMPKNELWTLDDPFVKEFVVQKKPKVVA